MDPSLRTLTIYQRARGRYTLCGEASVFHARGYEDCTIRVPGLRESGEFYTFLKKKERDFPCLGPDGS